jgi:hypothetical protein
MPDGVRGSIHHRTALFLGMTGSLKKRMSTWSTVFLPTDLWKTQ